MIMYLFHYLTHLLFSFVAFRFILSASSQKRAFRGRLWVMWPCDTSADEKQFWLKVTFLSDLKSVFKVKSNKMQLIVILMQD